VLACIANFSGAPKPDYRIGLPFGGRWREVLNTDAVSYGGSGVGNLGAVDAEARVWHGRPASAVLQLPPSGVLWLAPEPYDGNVKRSAVAAPVASTPVETADSDDLAEEVPASDAPARAEAAAGLTSDGPVQSVPSSAARPSEAGPAADTAGSDAGPLGSAETADLDSDHQ
jgi:1,4-alpha-glucan branching enzyme